MNSKSISNYTISYSAPVRDEKGNVIGVISSRFNWEYIYDILKNIKIDRFNYYNILYTKAVNSVLVKLL